MKNPGKSDCEKSMSFQLHKAHLKYIDKDT